MNRSCTSIEVAVAVAVAAVLVTSGCNRLLGIDEVTGSAGGADASPDAPADAAIDAPACLQPNPAIAGWWDGTQNGGIAPDLVNGLDGVANGVGIADAVVGDGFDFTGDTNVELPIDSSNLGPTFTVEAWVLARRAEVGITQGILSADLETQRSFVFGVTAVADAQVTCTMTNTAGGFFETTALTTIDEFHHYGCVYDGSSLSLYHDGVRADSVAASGTLNPSGTALEIGHDPFDRDPNRFLDGIVDELSLYDSALGSSEIQEIFVAGAGGKCRP